MGNEIPEALSDTTEACASEPVPSHRPTRSTSGVGRATAGIEPSHDGTILAISASQHPVAWPTRVTTQGRRIKTLT